MPDSIEQVAGGAMTYPAPGTFNRLVFKAPLVLWRLGLGPFLGRQMLVLTTQGRNTGRPRHTMLTCTSHEARYYVISGWSERADWYMNILHNPHVTVQAAGPPFGAVAWRVTDLEEFETVMGLIFRTGGDSHFGPWLESLDIAYDLQDVLAKRERVFLVALEPAEDAGPAPLPADLLWVWPLMLAAAGTVWFLWRKLRTGREA